MAVEETKTKDKYHHGALRATLIDIAFHVLETQGLEAISLRDLADQAGVSKTAPYRHFSDKRELLLVLASSGFTALADTLESGMKLTQGLDEAVEVLRALNRAYLNFARQRPALYKLMMASFGVGLHSENCRVQSERALGYLVDATTQAQQLGWKSDMDTRVLVMSLWASVHGWSGLLMDDLVPHDLGLSNDELFEQALSKL